MTHTIETISSLTALQDALGTLHTIMTTRSATNEERTAAALALATLALQIEDNLMLANEDFLLPVVR